MDGILNLVQLIMLKVSLIRVWTAKSDKGKSIKLIDLHKQLLMGAGVAFHSQLISQGMQATGILQSKMHNSGS